MSDVQPSIQVRRRLTACTAFCKLIQPFCASKGLCSQAAAADRTCACLGAGGHGRAMGRRSLKLHAWREAACTLRRRLRLPVPALQASRRLPGPLAGCACCGADTQRWLPIPRPCASPHTGAGMQAFHDQGGAAHVRPPRMMTQASSCCDLQATEARARSIELALIFT
jgi:hypothetical protein